MPYTILLVDDDREFKDEFKEYFDQYDIVTASNGDEALQIIKNPNSVDLVFMDVKMPGTRGTEVLKKIKEIDARLPIIILTGYSTKDVAIEALRAHADDYLEKPLNLERAEAIMKRFIGARFRDDGETATIEKVKYITMKNYQKNISLNDAAESVCLSPKYLSRLFKESTGIGFNDYKINLKIDKAKELLEQTAYTVNQIADKLGYQNAESFIRTFKKITALTPTEYRAQKTKATNAKR